MYESTSQASPRFDANSASGIDVGFKGALDLLRAWRDGRTPDPELTVSRWADSHRLLSPRGANEAGRWRTSRTPYLREIMDALSPMHPAQRIVVMKGAQIGATEAGNNWIGYIIHHAPGPMLAVQPPWPNCGTHCTVSAALALRSARSGGSSTAGRSR